MGAIGSALTAADEQAGVEMVTIDSDRLAQGQTDRLPQTATRSPWTGSSCCATG